MRKILFLTLAVLFITVGICQATNIPTTVDPKNYPTVWTEQVYNGSGATIVSGYIVEWDHATSDSDAGTAYDEMCPWVQLCDGEADVWTAGVLPYGHSILNGNVGAMIIRGPTYVIEGSTGVTANKIAESDSTGHAQDMSVAGDDEMSIGVCIIDDPTASGPDNNAAAWCIIFVDPTQHEI